MDIVHKIESESRERRARVRAVIAQTGNPEALVQFDRDMHDLDRGFIQARNLWQSLSEPQRKLMRRMASNPIQLVLQENGKRYDAISKAGRDIGVASLATVRALIARGHLECDGGAFDPEARVALTERGRFVVKYGQAA